jgi:hypothetical protein
VDLVEQLLVAELRGDAEHRAHELRLDRLVIGEPLPCEVGRRRDQLRVATVDGDQPEQARAQRLGVDVLAGRALPAELGGGHRKLLIVG